MADPNRPDPFKGRRGKRGRKRFRYTYDDIAKLLEVSVTTAKHYAHRGHYKPDDLESIARFWVQRKLGGK